MHITVFFLGNIAPDQLDQISWAVARRLQNISTFSLQLKQVKFAPPKKPYMLWATFHDSPAFVDLHHAITNITHTTSRSRKPIPHLTLARCKNLPGQIRRYKLPQTADLSLEVSEVILYQSTLRPEGPMYTALHKFSLAGHR